MKAIGNCNARQFSLAITVWHPFVKITFFEAKHYGKLLNQQMLENLSTYNCKAVQSSNKFNLHSCKWAD